MTMSDTQAELDLIGRLQGGRVLCVGDVMLDSFIYGDVDRISPEAPIPVLRVRRESAMLGGAGNVVRNLVALGCQPHFLAVVGDDLAGREITRLVGEHGEVDPLMVVEPDRQTTIKTRYIGGTQQLLRADHETQTPLAAGSRERLLAEARTLIGQVGVVVLSDYGKGVLGGGLTQALIAAARAAGKPVIVDPKGSDYTVYRGATVVTPNRKELHEATGRPVGSDEEVTLAARQLIELCGIETVLATRSQDGMSLISATGALHLPAEAREVFDVSGAGDTVVATLAAAVTVGASLAEAAKLANVAAGIVVGKVGTAVAYGEDLIHALHHSEMAAVESKLVSISTAIDQVARWRHLGKKVGFTNGCFDLLHPGHVSLLDQAKGQCDRLVVGLNSDASVKRLKGPTRPVQSEGSRGTVLASLAAVDLVVIFEQDTPLEVIRALRPDVLVKGADYSVAQVVGGDLVTGWGGRVFLADLQAGHSTTATIARMNK
jgi:D-beta-D-heptose 7-phosphate kinase/D-beta-D-heptose 1-phosphate adenosyltransferase